MYPSVNDVEAPSTDCKDFDETIYTHQMADDMRHSNRWRRRKTNNVLLNVTVIVRQLPPSPLP
jgi:hypothetical protein